MRAFVCALALLLTPVSAQAQATDVLPHFSQTYQSIVCNNEAAAIHLGNYYFAPHVEGVAFDEQPFPRFLFTAMRANACFSLPMFEIDSSVMVSEMQHWQHINDRLTLVRFTRINAKGEVVIFYGYLLEKAWEA